MRSPITCSNPKCDEQIGWHYVYEWGPNGCDPPENVFYNEDWEDTEGNLYCSQNCMEEYFAHESQWDEEDDEA